MDREAVRKLATEVERDGRKMAHTAPQHENSLLWETGNRAMDLSESMHAALDYIEAQEKRIQELERENAKLQLQLDTANRALEKSVRGD